MYETKIVISIKSKNRLKDKKLLTQIRDDIMENIRTGYLRLESIDNTKPEIEDVTVGIGRCKLNAAWWKEE